MKSSKLFRISRRLEPKSDHGGAFIELALVLPILLVLIGGAIDFGLLLMSFNSLQATAGDGARLAAAIENFDVDETKTKETIVNALEMRNAERSYPLEIEAVAISKASAGLKDFTTCDDMVTLTVSSSYKFRFLQMIGIKEVPMTKTASMRWLWQDLCG